MPYIHNSIILDADGYKTRSPDLDAYGDPEKGEELKPCDLCGQSKGWKLGPQHDTTTLDILRGLRNALSKFRIMTSEMDDHFRSVLKALRTAKTEEALIDDDDFLWLFGNSDKDGIFNLLVPNPADKERESGSKAEKIISIGRLLLGHNLNTIIDQIKNPNQDRASSLNKVIDP